MGIAEETFGFADQTVLVTGAARGIGRVTALLFAELGADLALVDRDAEGVMKVATEVESFGRRAVAVPADVRDPDACQVAIDRTAEALEGLDVLVNCAGGSRTKAFDKLTLSDFDAMMALNLRGPWLLSIAAIPHLRARSGSIVNISSMASMAAVEHSVPYGIAKAGLNNMTLALASVLQDHGIRVNGLALSAVKTEGFLKAMETMGVDPATARGGEPRDVAWAIVFLASKACPFMNGATIPLTGGGVSS